ncbi:MAG TPA: type II secretion system protein [Patescibacteria group bacterium]|nr:type II secretion system protein [Patescibacteria group bacterium]
MKIFKERLINNTKGFTFLELLIVMGIISLLFTFTLISYKGVQANARDTQRKNDLKQYQTLLETQANANGGFYPGRSTTARASDVGTPPISLCADLGISDCPYDPADGVNNCKSGLCRYFYQSNGTCDNGTDCGSRFVLYSRLEKVNNYFIVCSSGISGEKVNTTTFTAGACPL